MKRMRIYLLKLSLIIISVMFIDGGNTFILISTGAHFLTMNQNKEDIESPSDQHLSASYDCDNLFEKYDDHPQFYFDISTNIVYKLTFKSQDFIDLIWQPPRA
jgi:hypothetical protein